MLVQAKPSNVDFHKMAQYDISMSQYSAKRTLRYESSYVEFSVVDLTSDIFRNLYKSVLINIQIFLRHIFLHPPLVILLIVYLKVKGSRRNVLVIRLRYQLWL